MNLSQYPEQFSAFFFSVLPAEVWPGAESLIMNEEQQLNWFSLVKDFAFFLNIS